MGKNFGRKKKYKTPSSGSPKFAQSFSGNRSRSNSKFKLKIFISTKILKSLEKNATELEIKITIRFHCFYDANFCDPPGGTKSIRARKFF